MTELYDNGYDNDGAEMLCPFCNVPAKFREYLDREGGYLKKRVCENCKKVIQYPATKNTPSMYERIVYYGKCTGHKLMVTTQADRRPEYYTTVGVMCPTHNKLIEFSLPVN